MHRLRAPDGCPWDRKQTPKSLKPYIVEEAYEVLDAIDSQTPGELCEELGDLLLQIILQSELAAETGSFTVDDVIRGISAKLIHRHPHVFGDANVKNAEDVLVNWEQIKKTEKEGRGLFDGLPKQLPALQRARRMGEKAARVGFDWPDSEGVRQKVFEELEELEEAIAEKSTAEVKSEMGDLLFAVAQWARHLGIQPEEALSSCCGRFADRFGKMERTVDASGRSFDGMNIDELETIWQQVKKQ